MILTGVLLRREKQGEQKHTTELSSLVSLARGCNVLHVAEGKSG